MSERKITDKILLETIEALASITEDSLYKLTHLREEGQYYTI